MKTIAIIPARGGSKGVPRKNIRLLNGKPLLIYTIETAKKSQAKFDLVISTDDEEIAEVALKNQVEVIRRGQALSNDQATMPPVVKHVLDYKALQNQHYDTILLLQPTAPLRQPQHIDQSLKMLSECPDIPAVISVTSISDMHPARMYHIKNNVLISIEKENEDKNRQNLPQVYHRNGLIYAIRTSVFLKYHSFYIENTAPLITESQYSINIDEPIDFLFAECLIKSNFLKD